MDIVQIKTSQNVIVNYRAASVGDRILAYLIDSLVLIAYCIVIGLIFLIITSGTVTLIVNKVNDIFLDATKVLVGFIWFKDHFKLKLVGDRLIGGGKDSKGNYQKVKFKKKE